MNNGNSELNSIRTYLYENTLPWSGDSGDKKGPRICPTKKSIELLKELATLQKQFEAAKKRFVNVYMHRVDSAMTNLGSLADRALYPSSAEVGDLFSVSIDMVPVPEVSSFGKMNIPADLAQALGKRMEKQQSKIVDNATAELQSRALEAVDNSYTGKISEKVCIPVSWIDRNRPYSISVDTMFNGETLSEESSAQTGQ